MTVFEAMGFPVEQLVPQGSARPPISTRISLVDDTGFLGDEDSSEAIAAAADETWQKLIRAGAHIFNRPGDEPGLLRCRNFRYENRELIIEVQPTWFWTHLGTNGQVRAGKWESQEGMVTAERGDLADLAGSKLANVLSVNLTILTGDVPSPINPPTGCAFHPRCPQVTDRCKHDAPILKLVGEAHNAACHLVD